MRYLLSLSFRDGYGEPVQRHTDRDTLEEACEAAQRWLRLTRNTSSIFGRHFDQWSVAQSHPTKGTIIVASGHLEP